MTRIKTLAVIVAIILTLPAVASAGDVVVSNQSMASITVTVTVQGWIGRLYTCSPYTFESGRMDNIPPSRCGAAQMGPDGQSPKDPCPVFADIAYTREGREVSSRHQLHPPQSQTCDRVMIRVLPDRRDKSRIEVYVDHSN